MTNRLTTEEFIQRAKKIHGNLYDYSKVDYKGLQIKICIVDPEYGEFMQKPCNHLGGYGNKTRGYKKVSDGQRLNTKIFIERATKVHRGLYNYAKVEYVSGHAKVCIIDPDYGEFYQAPSSHLSGIGSPVRGTVAQADKRRMSLSEFIERANKVHDNLYDYSKVEYINSDTKVCIIDPIHGEFWQTPYGHLVGYGCSDRAIDKRANQRRMTVKEFTTRAKKAHDNLYDYSKVEYINSDTKVCIIDPIHGEFWQRPPDHLAGRGCWMRVYTEEAIHKDHIIPLSILGKRKEIDKERPLYRFLNSDANMQELPREENIKKSDLININGKQIRARAVRNDYNIIAILSEQLLNINIETIINEDRLFREIKL